MEKILKFRKNVETIDSEKMREQYKRDFQDYLKKRQSLEEKIIFIDTREQM